MCDFGAILERGLEGVGCGVAPGWVFSFETFIPTRLLRHCFRQDYWDIYSDKAKLNLVEFSSLRDQSLWIAKKGASQAWKSCCHSLLRLVMTKRQVREKYWELLRLGRPKRHVLKNLHLKEFAWWLTWRFPFPFCSKTRHKVDQAGRKEKGERQSPLHQLPRFDQSPCFSPLCFAWLLALLPSASSSQMHWSLMVTKPPKLVGKNKS